MTTLAESPDTLMLVVSYRCGLRCTYCPTRKDDEDMTAEVADRAVDRFIGGEYAAPGDPDHRAVRTIRFFGAEPTSAFHIIERVVERIRRRWPHRHQQLDYRMTTNGMTLNDEMFDFIDAQPHFELTVSIDGPPDTQVKHRVPWRDRNNPAHAKLAPPSPGATSGAVVHSPKPGGLTGGVASGGDPLAGISADWLDRVRERLLKTRVPVCVNTTIAPDQAARLPANVAWILRQGLRKLNFLPTYYMPWTPQQLTELREGFFRTGAMIARLWKEGHPVVVKNLFIHAPVTFYNVGIIVDTDGGLYNHNYFLTRVGAPHKHRIRIGHVMDAARPLTPFDGAAYDAFLAELLPVRLLEATAAADAELTRFVQELWPHWREHKSGQGRSISSGSLAAAEMPRPESEQRFDWPTVGTNL